MESAITLSGSLFGIFIVLAMASFVALAFAAIKLVRAEKMRFIAKKTDDTQYDIAGMPSVSVCIPARNEMNALSDCLERVLASDYPKLEVLVLDDNSSDSTSQIIRAFAHAGVRFIKGETPPRDWLGKNFALHTLTKEASGKYILFMDVDTFISPRSIHLLMQKLKEENLSMLSVVPQRADMRRASAWLSTLRYFWAIIFHSNNHPSASSAAWLIHRQTLADGFEKLQPFRRYIQPEQYIATELVKTSDYRLYISTPDLGLTYEKKISSQKETSQRLLAPLFSSSSMRSIMGMGLAISHIVILITFILTPIFSLMNAVSFSAPYLIITAPLLALSILVNLLFYRLFWKKYWQLSPFIMPLVAVREIYLYFASVLGYKKGTITWKGRAIALAQLEEKTKTSTRG